MDVELEVENKKASQASEMEVELETGNTKSSEKNFQQ